MPPEANDAPMDHIKKTSNATKEAILVKFIERQAYAREKAILKKDLDLFGVEEFAFNELLEEEAILKCTKEDDQIFYFLCDEFKPQKHYRKEVVMGFSIPLLIFLVGLILFGLSVVIYQIITAFF
ncbi:MAG: hypothetical protein JXA54_00210 [Candidatus Heimdallarchaeota archaeon]|nr:hypothetical protein [Candidatus Heimdallarchaeota archaeon]